MSDSDFHAKLTDQTADQVYFALAMFPYPSGAGLHVGHAENFTYVDIMARFQRMQGKTVVNPIGRDAFGLPTENYALKQGKPAHIVTQENINNFIAQCKMLDISYDRDREINTSSPEYYKRTQWIFCKLFEAGLVYRKDALVNRCNGCQTVLANDQVKEGKCERCETEIIQKKHPQWFIKITDYAERLIQDLDLVNRPEETKTHQKNRIGKSEGVEVDFVIEGGKKEIGHTITIYTTRPETIYGVTALMLAPENESLDHMLDPQMRQQVLLYRTQTSAKTNLQRQHTDKNKSGLFSELYARHPLTEQMIPVRYADYVLADYATGAVMFVPAHDERDYEFAQTINAQQSDSVLPIKQVIAPSFTKSYHPDLVKYRRDTVRAIIKHPDEDRYLFLTADDGRVRYVGGGIDDGLTVLESLVKEIREETGYTDIDIKHPIIITHFAKHVKSKGINSYGYCYYYYCELKSLDQDPISAEEYSKHQPVWMTVSQVEQHAQDIIFVRQYRQAKKYDLYLGDGVMINCGPQLDMLPMTQAKELIIQSIEQKGVGHRKINYKLRDRSVSRQRYRGSPIPIYYTFEDNENGQYTADFPHPDKSKRIPHLIPQEQLPVVLPLDLQNYKPAGKSPLEDHPIFKYYQQGDRTYLRECDTLDTFMCSTYYYLRFLDPHNTDHIIDPALDKVAMPIDFYMGGKEHTVGHLLYSRFVYKFLHDQGYVNHPEPFARLIHQGIVLAPDGRKMSKRRGNVINPSEVIAKYGVDVTRTYIAFMGPVEQDKCRDDNALGGVKRFLDRVTRLVDMVGQTKYSQDTQSKIHQTIKGVTEDIINLKYNTAISKLMILTNHFYEVKKLVQSDYEILLLLLAPFATQLTHTLWTQLGNTDDIYHHKRPIYDESQMISESAILAIQINGKMRGTITVQTGLTQDQVLEIAQADEKIAKYIVGQIVKIIFVPDKILNLIVK